VSTRTDVDRGLVIVAMIKDLKEELKGIETRLEKAGLAGEQIDLIDEEREGRQFLARGAGSDRAGRVHRRSAGEIVCR
jgi:hypothetical protein